MAAARSNGMMRNKWKWVNEEKGMEYENAGKEESDEQERENGTEGFEGRKKGDDQD